MMNEEQKRERRAATQRQAEYRARQIKERQELLSLSNECAVLTQGLRLLALQGHPLASEICSKVAHPTVPRLAEFFRQELEENRPSKKASRNREKAAQAMSAA